MTRSRLIATALVALLAAALSAPAAQAKPLLPDLDQVVPRNLMLERVKEGGKVRFRLGFNSATENHGDGPLTLYGYKRSEAAERMAVNQLVKRADGSTRVIRRVGGMEYVEHPDHHHWHLLGFARYEIRPMSTSARRSGVLLDQKTGFCLGDRYRFRGAQQLPAYQPFPAQGDTCGLGQPDLQGLFAGISVGYGDEYVAQLEGQYIDITSAAPGRYRLVHTANPDRRLLERNYANNASSLVFDLTWRRTKRGRVPAVHIVGRCADRADCAAQKNFTRTNTRKSNNASRRISYAPQARTASAAGNGSGGFICDLTGSVRGTV